MEELLLKEKISLYRDIYSELYSALKWKADKQALMLIAAIYVTNSKDFSLKRFMELADYIKEHVGMFSQLKSVQRFITAATLDTSVDDPKESFQHFITIYEKLIETGFSRNNFSYISAGTLVKVAPAHVSEVIQKTAAIYKGMKKNHFFLTNSGDYPLASTLALCEADTEEILSRVEEYYKKLNEKGLYKGNDLQFLSHILALETNNGPEKIADKCLMIKDILKKANFKIKSAYYPYIGMLSFLENPDVEIERLAVINDELNREKLFKWNKDLNFMISVLFLMNQLSASGAAARTGLNVSIETLIQAQQAAMTAGIAAAAASTSSSGSS